MGGVGKIPRANVGNVHQQGIGAFKASFVGNHILFLRIVQRTAFHAGICLVFFPHLILKFRKQAVLGKQDAPEFFLLNQQVEKVTARLKIKTGLVAEKDDVFGALEGWVGEKVAVVHGAAMQVKFTVINFYPRQGDREVAFVLGDREGRALLRHLTRLVGFAPTNGTLPDFILKFRRQIGTGAAERFFFDDEAQADERERQGEHCEDGGEERKELRHSGML